jgi:uncharacterized protein (TIGR03435 family)
MTSRTLFERRTVHNEGSIITATRMSMAELVKELETNVDRPIVDKTGLMGVYQFTLRLPVDEIIERMVRTAAPRIGSSTAASILGSIDARRGLSIFDSLKTLGLSLERGRVPVEMIVVDKISRTPTEN